MDYILRLRMTIIQVMIYNERVYSNKAPPQLLTIFMLKDYRGQQVKSSLFLLLIYNNTKSLNNIKVGGVPHYQYTTHTFCDRITKFYMDR